MSAAISPPLGLLQELLAIPALEPREALTTCASSVARWLECDKSDVFLFDEQTSSLVAMGTSQTPLGELQRSLGLDVMSLVQGGRAVQVYQTGRPHCCGDVERDPEELRGLVRELGIRSEVIVPLTVDGVRRGVLSLVSRERDRFGDQELQLVELAAGWTSALVHRAELVQSLREEERQRGRRVAAEEIISALAHDVWNHLNPLTARIQLLQLKLGRGEPVQPSSLDAVLLGTQHLARLTQDLLDAARLEQDLFELDLAPVDIHDLATDVARLCATPSTEVRVSAPERLTVIADSNRLSQALENVVLNAVRHSQAGAPVLLSIEAGSASATVTLRITDSGPGIEPALLPHLFERFVAEGPSKGLGLGLYLARRIALAHGGALEAKSQLGAGAEFYFVLPIAGPEPN